MLKAPTCGTIGSRFGDEEPLASSSTSTVLVLVPVLVLFSTFTGTRAPSSTSSGTEVLK